MFCVIQEIKLKKVTSKGESKYIEPTEDIINGRTIYSYRMSKERFIRDRNISYKITLQNSYRENGKVKKKQWHICNMSYYDIYEYSIYDCAAIKIKNLARELGVTEEYIYGLIDKKLDPLYEQIKEEYEQTEEYKTSQKHSEIIKKYMETKRKFDTKYGHNTYRQCYDVFGNLKNEERLIELKEQYKRNQEYQRSYYENSKSNYSNYNNSSYHENNKSSYNDEDKKILKKIYKKLAMEFHPDRNNNSNESQRAMQIINNLKDEWKI